MPIYINNMTLVKIGAIGGVLTVSMGYALRFQIDGKIKQTEYYKDALKQVRAHPAAVHLLGEPIKEGRIDVSKEEKNFTKGNKAQYEVPVWGPKQKGKVYFWARKSEDRWEVNRIELELKKEENRRLLITNLDNVQK